MTLVQSASQKHRVVQKGLTRSHFHGFPDTTLLESGALPIADIAELAMREGQRTNPLYRVHRWFARRLGSQFRSILTGLSLDADEAKLPGLIRARSNPAVGCAFTGSPAPAQSGG